MSAHYQPGKYNSNMENVPWARNLLENGSEFHKTEEALVKVQSQVNLTWLFLQTEGTVFTSEENNMMLV